MAMDAVKRKELLLEVVQMMRGAANAVEADAKAEAPSAYTDEQLTRLLATMTSVYLKTWSRFWEKAEIPNERFVTGILQGVERSWSAPGPGTGGRRQHGQ